MNNLIQKLYDTKIINKGEYKLKSGEISNYYFNMKNLISYPKLLNEICILLNSKIIEFKNYDLLCGVPLGGIPFACNISVKNNIPLIIPRDEKKNYGMKKQIEGNYNSKNKCIIIEDVITSGKSVKEVIELLENKVEIVGIVCIVNRMNIIEIKNYKIKYLLSENDIYNF